MGYYNVGRRSKKWWKCIFSYPLEVSVLNAYVLHKFSTDEIKENDYLAFHLALAIVDHSDRRSLGGRPHSMELAQCLRLDSTQDHLPECVPFKRDCYVCSKVREKKKLTRQRYRHESSVSTCDVHLCITKDRNCYKIYHTELDFANFIFQNLHSLIFNSLFYLYFHSSQLLILNINSTPTTV